MADKEYLGGVTNTTLHLETDGTIHVQETQDCEGIMHYAEAARNNRFDSNVLDGMMQHVAEIPMVIYIEECRKRGVALFTAEADLVMEAIIADPQYAKFRAAPNIRDPHIIMKGRR